MARLNRKLAAGLLAASMVMTILTASACEAQTANTNTSAENTTTVEQSAGTQDDASSAENGSSVNTGSSPNGETSGIVSSGSSDGTASNENGSGSTLTGSDAQTGSGTSTGSSQTSSASETVKDASEADTAFTFTDSGITASGGDEESYKIDGTSLTIKAAGTYVLSGSCRDGSVTVKKGTTGVTLILSGLTLANEGTATTATAPLSINKSTGVTIVVADGTVNTLSDSKYNNDETYTSNTEAENAVIKCKDGSQVTITGTGTLNIVSNGKNGIKSGTTDTETDAANPRDAYLTIENATVNITASVNDAINAEQELNILSGSLTISAADDAIHCDYTLNIGADGTAGPTITIAKSNEGIEGATINVYSGDIVINSADDLMNAANSDLRNYTFSLNIYGGTIWSYSTSGDGIDSNGTLNIYGGTVEVWTANTADNSPLDADGGINIQGGTVLAAGGSSGMGERLAATQAYITVGGTSGGMGGFGGWGGSSSQSIAKGSTVAVKDASGNTLYETTAPCNASYVIFSSASVTSGSTYTVTAGSATVGTATASTASSGGMGGFGGQGGMGGMQPGQGSFGGQQGGWGGQGQQGGFGGQSGTRPGRP